MKDKNDFRIIAEKLWCLLDDIDTASDMFKPSDERSAMAFYKYAMKKQAERHKYLRSDGYNLYTEEEFERHDTLSRQPTPDLCCGMYEEPPLELKICTHCGKEFKSNVDCPICPSCYL